MPQQQQQQWGLKESSNALYALVNIYATAVTVFLRSAFGKDALGWNGLLAFILLLAVFGFTASPAILIYLGAWLVVLVCRRIETFTLLAKGASLHSRCPGRPDIALKLCGGRWKIAIFVVEPLICLAMGGIFIDQGYGVLGKFLLGAAASLFLRSTFDAQVDDRRLSAMNDARLEQEYLQREYHRRY